MRPVIRTTGGLFAHRAFCWRRTASPAADEPQVGQPAPDFSTVDSQGQMRHLADYRGKVVVLEWTNADCPFTRKHYESGNMQSLQSLARDHGVVWLSVISSAPGKQGYVDGRAPTNSPKRATPFPPPCSSIRPEAWDGSTMPRPRRICS